MTWLTRGGVAAAVAVGAAVGWGLGWPGLALLLVLFLSGSLLGHFAEGRGPRRTARQVVANGGVAAVAALAGVWAVATGALAAATADTWATEIGSFSRVPPRLITTGALVSRGTSGGITVLGSAGGVVGAALIAGLAQLVAPRGTVSMGAGFATGTAAGVLGMVADSVLGATVQGMYACPRCDARSERGDTVCHEPMRLVRGWRWLDNDGVNLATTLVGAAAAALGSR